MYPFTKPDADAKAIIAQTIGRQIEEAVRLEDEANESEKGIVAKRQTAAELRESSAALTIQLEKLNTLESMTEEPKKKGRGK